MLFYAESVLHLSLLIGKMSSHCPFPCLAKGNLVGVGMLLESLKALEAPLSLPRHPQWLLSSQVGVE
ncbi:hypothetical protein HPP92_028871 [Vanilla planifolia]|uniref:Uncharacterized protein n=1 Tax=Vanilla planifolia TaxID=51239 RepID=A0A835P622_VANPL|nr:hypothetical protein HPP92_028871 [Vanilla planifolia]KAG0446373.1 hypothetical protein HPP92_028860 [Vanilla planifolia]